MASSDRDFEQVIGNVFTWFVILICVLVWLLFRYAKTVSQAWIADPKNKLFWIPAALGALFLLTGLELNANPALLSLAGLSFTFLWLASYVTCIRGHQRFERPWSIDDIRTPSAWWAEA